MVLTLEFNRILWLNFFFTRQNIQKLAKKIGKLENKKEKKHCNIIFRLKQKQKPKFEII